MKSEVFRLQFRTTDLQQPSWPSALHQCQLHLLQSSHLWPPLHPLLQSENLKENDFVAWEQALLGRSGAY